MSRETAIIEIAGVSKEVVKLLLQQTRLSAGRGLRHRGCASVGTLLRFSSGYGDGAEVGTLVEPLLRVSYTFGICKVVSRETGSVNEGVNLNS